MNKRELKLRRLNGSTAYDCVIEELKVLKRLDHPNIIWLHEIIDDKNSDFIYLVTNWHSKGDIE